MERDSQIAKKSGRSRPRRVVIAGGGTGGHLFPGIAIAEAFKSRDPRTEILFISTGNPFELNVLSQKGFRLERITAEGIKGRGLKRQLISLLKIPKGIIESVRILKRFKPDIVLGVGSYSSGPVVMAAWMMGRKIVLQEQNILPGITNRVLLRLADRMYVSFRDTLSDLNSAKVLFTGNPVQKKILKGAEVQKDRVSVGGSPREPFTVLVAGGSQGAHRINMVVLDALKCLTDKKRFFFVHQTGTADANRVKEAYGSEGVACAVQPFFTDMEQQYGRADLIICRAGATTLAEITAIGKATILIPYPFAADNHQVLNAKTLAVAGAAEMILQEELTGKTLAEKIAHYASSPDRLNLMASRARQFGQPEAAERIVDDCYQLAQSA